MLRIVSRSCQVAVVLLASSCSITYRVGTLGTPHAADCQRATAIADLVIVAAMGTLIGLSTVPKDDHSDGNEWAYTSIVAAPIGIVALGSSIYGFAHAAGCHDAR